MNLLDRCKTIREQIEKYNSLLCANKESEALRERTTTLQELYRELAIAISKVDVLLKRGFKFEKLPVPATALSICEKYQRALDDGLSEVDNFKKIKLEICIILRATNKEVANALKAIKLENFHIEELILQQVATIPTYREQVNHFRMARNALVTNSDPANMLPDELAKFLDKRDELRDLASQIKPAEIPQEVLDFFEAQRKGDGAPLKKFTEIVRNWLEERDLLKCVRVKVIAR